MSRLFPRVLCLLFVLGLAACSDPVSPSSAARHMVQPTSATHDEIIPDPNCRSGYNVTQGRCE